jgi:hypothetical protein
MVVFRTIILRWQALLIKNYSHVAENPKCRAADHPEKNRMRV